MTIRVGQIADLIDHQDGCTILAQPPSQPGIALGCRKIAQKLSSDGAEYRMTGDERLVRDIVREHCLANTVWTDKDDIRGLGNEI